MHMNKEDPYYFDTLQINMKNINLLQTFIFFSGQKACSKDSRMLSLFHSFLICFAFSIPIIYDAMKTKEFLLLKIERFLIKNCFL